MGGKKAVKRDESWEPRYGNDSRPWLLGFSKEVKMASTSTTQETYTADWSPKPTAEGIRRQLLKEALWQEARREVGAQSSTEVVDEEPVTEYAECFIKEGFAAEPIQTDPELHRKYPLYGDTAVSLWVEKFPALPGATRSPYNRHQFRRYAGFTKPLDETFDDSVEAKCNCTWQAYFCQEVNGSHYEQLIRAKKSRSRKQKRTDVREAFIRKQEAEESRQRKMIKMDEDKEAPYEFLVCITYIQCPVPRGIVENYRKLYY